MDGDDGVREQRSEVAPASEDEISRTSMLDVRSSEACAEFGEPAVAVATEREVSFGCFEVSSPSLSEELMTIISSVTSVDGLPSSPISSSVTSASPSIFFGVELRGRLSSSSTAICSIPLIPSSPSGAAAVTFILFFLHYTGTTARKSSEVSTHACPCALPGARPTDVR